MTTAPTGATGTTGTSGTDAWSSVQWDRPAILDEGNKDRAVGHLVNYVADRPGHTGPRYTGSMFTELGGGGDRPDVAHAFTAEDMVAVSTLSVHIPAEHALQLLGAVSSEEGDAETAIWRGSGGIPSIREVPIDAVEVGRLLAELPTDVDLVDATDEDLAVTDRLWREIRRKGLGPTRVSKLLARKRPRLCPVIDRDVRRQLDHGKNRTDFFVSLRTVLRDEALGLPEWLGELRVGAVAESDARGGGRSAGSGGGSVRRSGGGAVGRLSRLSDLRVLDIVLWMEEQEVREEREARSRLPRSAGAS